MDPGGVFTPPWVFGGRGPDSGRVEGYVSSLSLGSGVGIVRLGSGTGAGWVVVPDSR